MTYRLLLLDKGAYLSKPAILLDCTTDDEAIRQAKQFSHDHAVEVWRGPHLIELIPRKQWP